MKIFIMESYEESCKMMVQTIDHIVSELKEDLEKEKKEKEATESRWKYHQNQFYKLIAEMLETERIYIQDLEEVRKIMWLLKKVDYI